MAAASTPIAEPGGAATDGLPAPRGCTNLKLRQLTRLVTRHYETFFSASGLRITQYSLLSHVVRLDAVPCAELAEVMQLSPSALTRTLQPLVEQGWLAITSSPDGDGRRRFVQATPAGRLKRDELQRIWKQAQVALNQRLGPARVAALHALLDDGIERLAAGEPVDQPMAGETP